MDEIKMASFLGQFMREQNINSVEWLKPEYVEMIGKWSHEKVAALYSHFNKELLLKEIEFWEKVKNKNVKDAIQDVMIYRR